MNHHRHQPGPFARLAAFGLLVFPLYHRSKVPAVASWTPCRRRRPEPAELRAWDAGPPRNVAVVTGAPGGVIVLDVDGPAGARTLLGLGLGPGALPRTWCVRTGKGLHLYYRHPGFPVANRVGLLPGLDVRGDGGYAVAPPSIHPDGRAYCWVCEPEEVPLAEVPGWLLRLIQPTKPGVAPPPSRATKARRYGRHTDRYAQAALAGELSAVCTTPEGGRNDRLSAAAISLGGLVGAGALERANVEEGLLDAALDAGLGRHEARATIESGLEAGIARPRALPEAPRSRYAALYPAARGYFRPYGAADLRRWRDRVRHRVNTGELPRDALDLARALASFAGLDPASGACNPSQEALLRASKLGSRRTLQRRLERLEGLRLIHRYAAEGLGGRLVTLYTLCLTAGDWCAAEARRLEIEAGLRRAAADVRALIEGRGAAAVEEPMASDGDRGGNGQGADPLGVGDTPDLAQRAERTCEDHEESSTCNVFEEAQPDA